MPANETQKITHFKGLPRVVVSMRLSRSISLRGKVGRPILDRNLTLETAEEIFQVMEAAAHGAKHDMLFEVSGISYHRKK